MYREREYYVYIINNQANNVDMLEHSKAYTRSP